MKKGVRNHKVELVKEIWPKIRLQLNACVCKQNSHPFFYSMPLNFIENVLGRMIEEKRIQTLNSLNTLTLLKTRTCFEWKN